jgi:uncharacterized Zn-binding protein involved in type VI secretion
MPGVVRKGTDAAGGTELGGQVSTVFVNGVNVVVLGDKVQPHGKSPHGPSPPTMVEASSTVFAQGVGICKAGDKASCDHPATGSSDVLIG